MGKLDNVLRWIACFPDRAGRHGLHSSRDRNPNSSKSCSLLIGCSLDEKLPEGRFPVGPNSNFSQGCCRYPSLRCKSDSLRNHDLVYCSRVSGGRGQS